LSQRGTCRIGRANQRHEKHKRNKINHRFRKLPTQWQNFKQM
jgi:hypothetical protein